MKNRSVQGMIILILFLVFIVAPSLGEKELGPLYSIYNEYNFMNNMIYGIIHINSLVFVAFTALILWLSIDKDRKKANTLHEEKNTGLIDARYTLEGFFEDKIELNELVEKSKNNQTLKSILNIIKYGAAEEDLILGLQKIYTNISSNYIKLKNDYEYLATIMPIVGMIGTIAGLLTMFAAPDEMEDYATKFSGLSVALATTLYASMITVLFFKPKARGVDEWIVDLEEDYNYFEISLKQFFHKVDITELEYLIEAKIEEQDD